MKALILAAGYGTRLGEVTKHSSKILLDIAGKPMINYIIEKIEELSEIDTIYIITNNKFYNDFVDWKENIHCLKPIEIINNLTNHNAEKRGTIGDLHYAIKEKNINDDLLVIGGDNLFSFTLEEMYIYFSKNQTTVLGVIDLKQEEKLANIYGVVETDENNKIIVFEEKPTKPKTTLAAMILYFLHKKHLDTVSSFLQKNIGERNGDLIKFLAEHNTILAFPFTDDWIDIGDKHELDKAREIYTHN